MRLCDGGTVDPMHPDGVKSPDRASEGTPLVSLEEYRTAAETSVDGVMITAPDGRILYANRAACAMLRATPDEIAKKGRQGFTPVNDVRWESAVEERSHTGRTELTAPMLRGDGSRFMANLTSSVFDGTAGEARTIVIIRDVTARLRLEQRSRALNEITGAILRKVDTGEVLTMIGRHARLLLEATDAAVMTAADPPGYIRIAAADGAAMSRLLGREYPPASVAGQVMAERKGVLVQDLTLAARTQDGRRVGLGPGVIVPVISGERVYGVVMVGAAPGSRPYDDADLEDVKALADAAAVALDVGEARTELEAFHRQRSEQLQEAFTSRIIIEQAKGFLSATRGISSEEAFQRLRKYARSHSTNVHDIASRVMDRSLML